MGCLGCIGPGEMYKLFSLSLQLPKTMCVCFFAMSYVPGEYVVESCSACVCAS